MYQLPRFILGVVHSLFEGDDDDDDDDELFLWYG